MAKEEKVEFEGEVVEALPNAMFRVQLDNGHEVLGHVAGKMRRFRIRILPGDRVRVEVSPYEGNNPLYRRGFLRVSENRRYLVYGDGTPFLWIGDTAWGSTVPSHGAKSAIRIISVRTRAPAIAVGCRRSASLKRCHVGDAERVRGRVSVAISSGCGDRKTCSSGPQRD